MDEDIYFLAGQLKEAIHKDPRIVRLEELESLISNDKEVMALAYAKDVASSEYSDILNHYDENSEIAQKYQKKLYEAKKALDNHPLVKEYYGAYSEARGLYGQINSVLFGRLNADLCPKGKKK